MCALEWNVWLLEECLRSQRLVDADNDNDDDVACFRNRKSDILDLDIIVYVTGFGHIY